MSISKEHIKNKRLKKGLYDENLFFALKMLQYNIESTIEDEHYKYPKIQRAKIIKKELMKRDNK